jgi:hypothetical protein
MLCMQYVYIVHAINAFFIHFTDSQPNFRQT